MASLPVTAIETAAHALARGGLVVFPTESVYGLGVDACAPAAVERLLAVRGREPTKPMLVLVRDLTMAAELATDLPPLAARLAGRFWPGPLSLVVPARAGLPAALTAGSGTIGMRQSAHPVAAALVRRFGRPITAPSANPPGATPARTVAEARAYFGAAVSCYLDGGRCDGQPSTVVVVEGTTLRVLRPGPISEADLRAASEEET